MKKPKKFSKFRVAFTLDCDNLREEANREAFLLLMPIARPSDAAWDDALKAELRILYGEGMHGNEWRPTVARELDAALRVLWGWATPWRTKANPLTWQAWDSFCQVWFGKSCALQSRPKEFDLNALCEEIRALEQAGSVVVVGNYPFSSKLSRAKKIGTAEPKSDRGRRKKPRSAADFDEEPQGGLPDGDRLEENEVVDFDDEESATDDEDE